MKAITVPIPKSDVVVATIFAVCGAVSAILFASDFPPNTTPEALRLPVPFALLCAFMFLRTWRVILAAPLLMIAVWLVAVRAAVFLGVVSAPFGFPPGCLGGLIGGLGLVLCASICYRSLFAIHYLFRGAATGTVAALPFALWTWSFLKIINGGIELEKAFLVLALAIWQGAMGRFLFTVCTEAKQTAPPGPEEAKPPSEGKTA